MDNESPVIQALNQIANLNRNALFAQIGAEVVEITRKRFMNQRDIDGVPWKRSQRAIKQNGQTLRDKGRLLNSFTYNVLPNGVEAGTNVVYAAIHNSGGPVSHGARLRHLHFKQNKDGTVGNKFVRKSRSNFVQEVMTKAYVVNMPKRSFLGINKDDEESIIDVISGFLMNGR